METQPLLSVIMPVYNAEQYLERSISDVLGSNISKFGIDLSERWINRQKSAKYVKHSLIKINGLFL